MAIATRPKPKAHHRKRQAGHHKRSKHYAKAYWPYLPMLLLVAIGIAVNSVWSNGQVLGANTDLTSTRLLAETNTERSAEGQAKLTLSPELSQAAQAKAEDMVKRDYWSHAGPKGESPWTFVAASGYQYQLAGENLAYGFDTSDQVVTGWMRSSTHRANMLNTNYSQVGFGIASTPDYLGNGPQVVIVAEYAQPTSVSSASAVEPTNQSNAEQAETPQPDIRHISRIELWGGNQGGLVLIITLSVTAGAFIVLLVQHHKRFHAVLVRGERFLIERPLLDVAIVGVVVVGILLTRSAGVIH